MGRVLVIDDDRGLAQLVCRIMAQEGHRVESSYDGLNGLEKVTEWRPDLILLDIMMPDIDGIEVCRRIRQADSAAKIPIVMLTARTSIEDKERAFTAEADDYITKPVDPKELQLRVAALLRRSNRMTDAGVWLPTCGGDMPLVLTVRRSGLFRSGYRVAKRIFDLLCCFVALPVILPIGIIIVIGILIDSPGPIFFIQERTGWNGRRFKMYKFRTMCNNAEDLKSKYQNLNELKWPDFKIANDPRITRMGRLLRRTSLDEIPQFFNVVKGEMSIVGPRPTSFPPTKYNLWQTERLEVLPGLTGLWQVSGRANLDFDERVELDLEYIEHQSFALDLRILLQTVGTVINGRGAH